MNASAVSSRQVSNQTDHFPAVNNSPDAALIQITSQPQPREQNSSDPQNRASDDASQKWDMLLETVSALTATVNALTGKVVVPLNERCSDLELQVARLAERVATNDQNTQQLAERVAQMGSVAIRNRRRSV